MTFKPNKSAWPMRSLREETLKISKYDLISSAINLNSCITCSGAPTNFALRFSSWVAIPTGHVFSWHWRTILHPNAKSGRVPNPYLSAPNRVAMITSLGDLNPPSTSRRTLSLILFSTSA